MGEICIIGEGLPRLPLRFASAPRIPVPCITGSSVVSPDSLDQWKSLTFPSGSTLNGYCGFTSPVWLSASGPMSLSLVLVTLPRIAPLST